MRIVFPREELINRFIQYNVVSPENIIIQVTLYRLREL